MAERLSFFECGWVVKLHKQGLSQRGINTTILFSVQFRMATSQSAPCILHTLPLNSWSADERTVPAWLLFSDFFFTVSIPFLLPESTVWKVHLCHFFLARLSRLLCLILHQVDDGPLNKPPNFCLQMETSKTLSFTRTCLILQGGPALAIERQSSVRNQPKMHVTIYIHIQTQKWFICYLGLFLLISSLKRSLKLHRKKVYF